MTTCRLIKTALALLAIGLTGCSDQTATRLPAPHELSPDAVAEFCGMTLAEHPGPKGQIFVKALSDHPYWFASARDALAFTMLPEAPKDIAAVYVSDMGKAQSWARPDPGSWVEAHRALFVIGSRRQSAMGDDEAVPFADPDVARQFVAENGGELVRFAEIPRDYILGGGRPSSTPPDPAAPDDGGSRRRGAAHGSRRHRGPTVRPG